MRMSLAMAGVPQARSHRLSHKTDGIKKSGILPANTGPCPTGFKKEGEEKMKRRTLLACGMSLVMAAGLFSGCGGSGEENTAASGSTEAAQSGEAASQEGGESSGAGVGVTVVTGGSVGVGSAVGVGVAVTVTFSSVSALSSFSFSSFFHSLLFQLLTDLEHP